MNVNCRSLPSAIGRPFGPFPRSQVASKIIISSFYCFSKGIIYKRKLFLKSPMLLWDMFMWSLLCKWRDEYSIAYTVRIVDRRHQYSISFGKCGVSINLSITGMSSHSISLYRDSINVHMAWYRPILVDALSCSWFHGYTEYWEKSKSTQCYAILGQGESMPLSMWIANNAVWWTDVIVYEGRYDSI